MRPQVKLVCGRKRQARARSHVLSDSCASYDYTITHVEEKHGALSSLFFHASALRRALNALPVLSQLG